MDLVLKARGIRITDEIRRTAEHKLARIGRHDPRAMRIEVEIIAERNPRIDSRHRVEVACATSRHTFRAGGAGLDVGAALDEAVTHLERQIASHRGRVRDRMSGRGNRLQSLRTSNEEAGASE